MQNLEQLAELQRSCIKLIYRGDKCLSQDFSSEVEVSRLLHSQTHDMPPRISEILVKDDAFSKLMDKTIKEISLLVASCFAVSFFITIFVVKFFRRMLSNFVSSTKF